MSNSFRNPPSQPSAASLEITGELFTPVPCAATLDCRNDALVIRRLVTEAIRKCGKSRQEIADHMSLLLGCSVTKRALDSFTSEASDQNRFPAQYLRAFCRTTGDWSLIHCVSEGDGFRLIDQNEQKLLELGREYLRRKRAEKTISAIEQQFDGVEL